MYIYIYSYNFIYIYIHYIYDCYHLLPITRGLLGAFPHRQNTVTSDTATSDQILPDLVQELAGLLQVAQLHGSALTHLRLPWGVQLVEVHGGSHGTSRSMIYVLRPIIYIY